VGHLLAQQMLLLDRGVGGATAHGEVVAADHDRPAVDPGPPEDEVRRREVGEVVVTVVARLAGDLAQLVKAAGVDEPVDPLADGQSAAVVLSLDARGAAELLGKRLAPPQLLHLGLPSHDFAGGPEMAPRPPSARTRPGGAVARLEVARRII
jgi:hypothetical protein